MDRTTSSSYSSGLSCINPNGNGSNGNGGHHQQKVLPKPILKQQAPPTSIDEYPPLQQQQQAAADDNQQQQLELYERQELYESLMRQYYDEMEKLEIEQSRVRELLAEQMQSNLVVQRQPKTTGGGGGGYPSSSLKYPVVPFKGPFFNLEEVFC